MKDADLRVLADRPAPIFKSIIAYGSPRAIACDARCDKAWGINNRPKVQLSDDPDDYYFLADDELGTAPDDPGTYEGDQAKPRTPEERLNKWCFRECERCESADREDGLATIESLTRRRYNIPSSEPTEVTNG